MKEYVEKKGKSKEELIQEKIDYIREKTYACIVIKSAACGDVKFFDEISEYYFNSIHNVLKEEEIRDIAMTAKLAGCTKHVKKFVAEPDGVFIPTELFEQILRRLLK